MLPVLFGYITLSDYFHMHFVVSCMEAADVTLTNPATCRVHSMVEVIKDILIIHSLKEHNITDSAEVFQNYYCYDSVINNPLLYELAKCAMLSA